MSETPPRPGNPAIYLRVPTAIGQKLRRDAARSQPPRTVQTVILDILSQHYAVEVPAPARGGWNPKKKAAKKRARNQNSSTTARKSASSRRES